MKTKLLLLTGLITVMVAGCKKEIIKEVERDYRWKAHPYFLYDNSIILNSFSTDSLCLFIGTNFTTFVNSDLANYGGFYDNIFGNYSTKYFNIDFVPSNRILPISPDITLICEDELSYSDKSGKVYFISTNFFGLSSSRNTYIYVSEKDTSYTGFNFDRSTLNECMAINTQGQALIPYYSSVNHESRFLLVNTHQTGNQMEPTEIESAKIIPIEDVDQRHIAFLQSYKDEFFVTTDSKTFLINSDGGISKFDDLHLYNIIPKNDTLYTFSYDFTLPGMGFLYSTDNGFNWNRVSTAEQETAYINYSVIAGRVVGYWKSQLWEFSLEKDGYHTVELDNDGLEGKIITSVSGYKDKVYVTTLSGVYYKNTTDLFQEKAAE
jgi:hypothetical protein